MDFGDYVRHQRETAGGIIIWIGFKMCLSGVFPFRTGTLFHNPVLSKRSWLYYSLCDIHQLLFPAVIGETRP